MVSKIDSPALTLPPGEFDVQEHVLVGVLAFQEQQLRATPGWRPDRSRRRRGTRCARATGAVDIVGALAATRLFDDHGHHAQAMGFDHAHFKLSQAAAINFVER